MKNKLKLLKFDTINPQIYIINEIEKDLERFRKMDRQQMLDWIISTRGNFSDFYTYNLRKLGWETEEFFTNKYYLDKVADELYGSRKKFKFFTDRLKDKIRPVHNRQKLNIMKDYIRKFQPDVILVREQIGIPSSFWNSFRNEALLVSRLAAPVPKYWSPADWDMILTSTNAYKTFFELNGIPSYINPNGFDSRVLKELGDNNKKYEVTFVGGLGNGLWTKRTRCIEYLTERVDIKWWGYNNTGYAEDHPLMKNWQGLTSGLDMLNIYRQSKIIFNDYGEIAEGVAVNQRMFEVMGTGSFLLTRSAENLLKEFPKDIFITFDDERDCLDKVNYFLKNEKEREDIAKAGQKFILENYDYSKLMIDIDLILKENYKKKFPRKANLLVSFFTQQHAFLELFYI